MREAFEGFAGGEGHPCLGARSVVRRGAYRLQVYSRLGSSEAASLLNADLAEFAQSLRPSELTSLVAVFTEPSGMTEADFSRQLWRQLQHMHDLDHSEHPWDPTVSSNPADPHFSFSIAGTAYFIVGLHAGSSRWSRRFAWPTLVFNPHQQFEALRRSGAYDRMRSLISGRDEALQGTVNPALRDHGLLSEASQYAGASVDEQWQCPLDVHEPR